MMNNGRTKGEIEAAIRTAIIKFEQEFMGRGPDDVARLPCGTWSWSGSRVC